MESGMVRREGGYRAMSKLIWSQPCIHIMQAVWVGGESHGNLLSKESLKLDWTPETRSFTVAEFHDLENSS